MRAGDVEPRNDQFQTMAEPAPCEGCKFAAKCRADKLCCEKFGLYLHGAGEARWTLAPMAPTHARFEALLDLGKRPLGRAKKIREARKLQRLRAQRGAPPLAV
jgi:hypothetical protein